MKKTEIAHLNILARAKIPKLARSNPLYPLIAGLNVTNASVGGLKSLLRACPGGSDDTVQVSRGDLASICLAHIVVGLMGELYATLKKNPKMFEGDHAWAWIQSIKTITRKDSKAAFLIHTDDGRPVLLPYLFITRPLSYVDKHLVDDTVIDDLAELRNVPVPEGFSKSRSLGRVTLIKTATATTAQVKELTNEHDQLVEICISMRSQYMSCKNPKATKALHTAYRALKVQAAELKEQLAQLQSDNKVNSLTASMQATKRISKANNVQYRRALSTELARVDLLISEGEK